MRRRTWTAVATVALIAALAGCGGRTDGGNPGNLTTTSTIPPGQVDGG